MVNLYSRTSITVDEAIANLLDLLDGPVVFRLPETEYTQTEEEELENLIFDLNDVLLERYESLSSQLAEAKYDGEAEIVISKLSSRVDAARQNIELANRCRCAIDDELFKPSPVLVTDPRLSREGMPYITLESLRKWADTNQTIAHVRLQLLSSDVPVAPGSNGRDRNERWWQPVDGDPPAKPDSWYIPARYFARELVKVNPTLGNKRDLLAKQIVKKLTEEGIYKRGGVKSLDPATVKKALVNVKFS